MKNPNSTHSASALRACLSLTRTLWLIPFTVPAVGDPLFSKLAEADTGIDHRHTWEMPDNWQAINSYAPMAGVAMADYDGDGKLDLFLGDQKNGGNLYRNLGDFRFENTTKTAGLKMEGRWTTGVSFADVNGDGHPDLFLGSYQSPNSLYLNNGDGTFKDFSKESSLGFSGATVVAAFADYDRDGDLDCYLLTNRLPSTPGLSAEATLVDGKLTLPEDALEFKNIVYDKDGNYHVIDSGQRDYMFRNDGSGRFTDVTKEIGVYGSTAPGLSASWWDADNDMWPDLYVANDFYLYDQLWMNKGGNQFQEQHAQRLPHQPWFSMGSDFADLNNDGHFDYVATDMSPSSHFRSKLTMGDMSADSWFLDSAEPPQVMRNAVYINAGDGHFFELAQMLGLSSTDWTWAARAADLDCDGNEDLFFSTGMTKDFENSDLNDELMKILSQFPEKDYESRSNASREFWSKVPQQRDSNFAFRNEGDLKFTDVSSTWGLDETSVSSGVGIGDLDNDGDPDLVVMNYDEAPFIYRNNTTSNRLKFRLKGSESNRDGVGARLILTHEDGTENHRMVSLSRGYLSSSGPEVLFGLGSSEKAASLRVIWPSGKEQLIQDIDSNQTLTIEEKNAGPGSDTPFAPGYKKLFNETEQLAPVAHEENVTHDEFIEEPLLPHRVSQLGPGLAIADLNRDGNDDLILTRAAGASTLIACNTKNGLATIQETQTSLNAHSEREDLAPLIFDADGDGDLDLLITCGGSEAKEGSEVLRDRLYLNDGAGRLTAASQDALPDLRFSSGTACAADYDRDGDLDLFIGGRIVPGNYPVSPRSALLRNDSKPGEPHFTDVTESLAPALMKPGMVTSAVWSDATGDGWIDLLIALEWGPVSLFANKEGKRLENMTESSGIADQLGWFNSISAGDIDHDGDIDYLVGNFGRNTKYHPSCSDPARIYHGDFDDSGKGQIIEAKVKKGTMLPVRGKSCSQNAMPFIRSKFPTYKAFAEQKLVDIYPEDKLAHALKLEANTLDSALLINDGKGHFEFKSLPAIAQASPTFGTSIVDLNGDSHPDLVLAQNFHGPQRETGRYDGGLGLVLLGDGKGEFEPLWPNVSGFSIKADATALALADLNQDQKPDLVVATNNGPTRSLLNQSTTGKFRTLRLHGPAGNPSAVGAKVTIHYSDGSQLHLETSCGGGYLSQSTPTLFFGHPKDQTIEKIDIVWPDGVSDSIGSIPDGPIQLKRS